MTALALKLCRSCNRTDAQTRFDRMCKTRCIECSGIVKDARAIRIQERGPRVCEVVRDDPNHIPPHIKWIEGLPCAVHGPSCEGRVLAHHVRTAANSGTGMKPSDAETVPVCGGWNGKGGHHAEGHQKGWITFERKYNVDLLSLARRLAAASPHVRRAA